MNLPELPRQSKQKEGSFAIDLKHQIENSDMDTCSLETKHTRGKKSFPFNELKPEQISYASRINSSKGAWIRTLGMNGEPDYIWLRNENAFICIKYPQGSVIISIKNFLKEKESSKKKSLSFDRAVWISQK